MKCHSSQVLILLLLASLLAACGGQPPEPPKAVRQFSDTQACVEPLAEMRKNHMEYILHQRDETVHAGIRTRKHSFEECINCHVAQREDGSYPSVGTKDHFCSSCHAYAAVKIDCFQCHNDNPVRPSMLSLDNANYHADTTDNLVVLEKPEEGGKL